MHLPDSLAALAWELPHNFLGLDEEAADFERARVVILPVPYESTTSYGGGTGQGGEHGGSTGHHAGTRQGLHDGSSGE